MLLTAVIMRLASWRFSAVMKITRQIQEKLYWYKALEQPTGRETQMFWHLVSNGILGIFLMMMVVVRGWYSTSAKTQKRCDW